MNKTTVFGVIWRYIKFLVAFLLLLGSVNALHFISTVFSPSSVASPIIRGAPRNPNEKEVEDGFESGMIKIMETTPTQINRKATVKFTPSKADINMELSVDARSQLAAHLLHYQQAKISYRQPTLSANFIRWLFGAIGINSLQVEDIKWDGPFWSSNETAHKLTLSINGTVLLGKNGQYLSVYWGDYSSKYGYTTVHVEDELRVAFENAIFRAASRSPSSIKPNEITFQTTWPAEIFVYFELLPEKPSLTRQQQFMRNFGDFSIPFLSPLLYALVELLPLGLLASVAYGVFTSSIKIPAALKRLTAWLLGFHFLLYFFAANHELYIQRLIRRFRPDSLNNFLAFFTWNLNDKFQGAASVLIIIAAIGVILLFIHFQPKLDENSESQTKIKQKRWIALLIEISLIFGVVVSGYCIWWFAKHNIAAWSCDYRQTNEFIRWLLCAVPAWSMILFVISAAHLVARWTIPPMASSLWNKKSNLTTLWMATLVILIVINPTILFAPIFFVLRAIYSTSYQIPPTLAISSLVWLGLNIVLGTLLLYQFGMALLRHARDMEISIDPKRLTPWVFALALFFSIPAYYGDKTAQMFSYQDDVIRLAFALDNIFLYLWVAAILWLLYQDGKTDLSLNKHTRWIGALGAASVLFNVTARWMYIPAAFLLGWLALSWLMRRQAWEEKHNLNRVFKQVVELRPALFKHLSLLHLAEQTLGALQKKKREKISAGDEDFNKARKSIEKHVASIERLREEPIKGVDRDFKHLPLAFGPKSAAWENGLHGAKWSALISLPWLTLNFIGFMQATDFSHAYLLDAVDSIFAILMFWSGVGFVLGYFFPYLRGDSGLQKGIRLALALILPTLPLHLLHYQTLASWQGFFLWAFQVFFTCILLGLFAFDYLTIRGTGKNWETLLEIHGLFSVGAWTSSVIVGLAAAISNWIVNPAQMQAWLSSAAQIVLPVASQADTFFK